MPAKGGVLTAGADPVAPESSPPPPIPAPPAPHQGPRPGLQELSAEARAGVLRGGGGSLSCRGWEWGCRRGGRGVGGEGGGEHPCGSSPRLAQMRPWGREGMCPRPLVRDWMEQVLMLATSNLAVHDSGGVVETSDNSDCWPRGDVER